MYSVFLLAHGTSYQKWFQKGSECLFLLIRSLQLFLEEPKSCCDGFSVVMGFAVVVEISVVIDFVVVLCFSDRLELLKDALHALKLLVLERHHALVGVQTLKLT